MTDNPGGTATVAVDGYDVTSNTESAEDMIAALSTKDDESSEPREVKPKGAADEKESKKSPLSKAASELGKKGGEAAAKARAAADKAKPEPATADDEAEGDETADDNDERPTGKPRDDPRARMRQATEKEAAAKRALADERQQRERLEARLAALEQRRSEPAADPSKPEARPGHPPPATAPEAGKPKAEDFELYEDYVEALTDYKTEQKFKAHEREQQVRQQAKAHTDAVVKHVNTFNGRIEAAGGAEFMARVDPRLLTFRPSLDLPPGTQLGAQNVIADEIMASEHSPALLEYLTENEDVVRMLLHLPNQQAISRAIGRIEARFQDDEEAPKSRPKQEFSRAKPPVRPVAASPHSSGDDVSDEDDYDSHVRKMNLKEKRRR